MATVPSENSANANNGPASKSPSSEATNPKDGDDPKNRGIWGQIVDDVDYVEANLESRLPDSVENWLAANNLAGKPILFGLLTGLGFYLLYKLSN